MHTRHHSSGDLQNSDILGMPTNGGSPDDHREEQSVATNVEGGRTLPWNPVSSHGLPLDIEAQRCLSRVADAYKQRVAELAAQDASAMGNPEIHENSIQRADRQLMSQGRRDNLSFWNSVAGFGWTVFGAGFAQTTNMVAAQSFSPISVGIGSALLVTGLTLALVGALYPR